MKKGLAIILSCAITCTAMLPAFAQENPSFDLEQVVVTAAKREQAVKDTPASIAVITAQDLKKMGAKSFDDALRSVAGVVVNRPYGQGLVTPQSINIRGIQGPDRTLLLIDGVPINNAVNDFVNLNILPIDSIEKVEVVKGGYSALYGSNALGGVINIITKAGIGLKEGQVKTSIKTELGNYGTKNYKASLEGAGEKINYSLNWENNHTDNYLYNDRMLDSLSAMDKVANTKILGTAGTGPSAINFVERDAYNLDYDGTKINGKFKYQINEQENLTFLAGYSKNESGNKESRSILKTPPTFPPQTVPRDSVNNSTEKYWGLNYQAKINEKTKATIRFSQTKSNSEYLGEACIGMIKYPMPYPPFSFDMPNFVPSTRKTDSTLNKVELQLENKVNEKNYLIFGLDKDWKEGNWYYTNDNNATAIFPNVRTQAKDNNWAAYLQNEIKLNEKTDLVVGGRYDKHSEFGSAFSPKAGVVYKLDDKTRVKANAGRSFKAPGLYQLYEPDWFFAPFNVFRSNPDLKAEKVNSYDLGIEKDFSDKVTGSITIFLNNQKDLITTKYVGIEKINGTDVGIRQYQNIDSAQAKGIEANLKNTFNKNWSTDLSYTYLDDKDKSTDKRVDGVALHNISLGLYYNSSLNKDNFSAGLIARGVSGKNQQNYALRRQVALPGYTVFDLKLGWQFADKGDIFFNVQNLADKQYQDDANNYMSGRSIIGGVSYKF